MAPEGKITSPITEGWLNAVVSIEILGDKQPRPIGTGFLLRSEKQHAILVTAKHVATGEGERLLEHLAYRFNNTEHALEGPQWLKSRLLLVSV